MVWKTIFILQINAIKHEMCNELIFLFKCTPCKYVPAESSFARYDKNKNSFG